MKAAWILAGTLIFAGLAAWAGLEVYDRAQTPTSAVQVPTTLVRRGDVIFSVVAQGELQGGNLKMLTAPMSGGVELILTDLRQPGEVVKPEDVVAQFDTTELTFNLREAEADLAEAQERLRQATAESLAKDEESRYALLKAESDLKLAELEARRNDLLASIVARQNILALDAARDRLNQLRTDLASRKATTEAGVAIQEAAVTKAQVKAETARQTIDAMTLRAPSDGYVSIQANTGNVFSWGMELPIFQVGDIVRPGMGVAQIPNLDDWQISAQIGELDRGHLAVGQGASITVVAAPGRVFTGRVTNIGNTTGPPWDRRFECKLSIDDPTPELRPGMSVKVEIITAELRDVLWLPSQAVFNRDGQRFVYLRRSNGFSPSDVELVRAGESKLAIQGLKENDVVALADPTQQKEAAAAPSASDVISRP